MSASLVGSEMCIRDSLLAHLRVAHQHALPDRQLPRAAEAAGELGGSPAGPPGVGGQRLADLPVGGEGPPRLLRDGLPVQALCGQQLALGAAQ
eukprot:8554560-Alexandrium_andersonii.AAC.1